jgi:DNA-binding MarR family transcriptional regulator
VRLANSGASFCNHLAFAHNILIDDFKMNPKQLPIGYWIKQVDELLTKNINEIQSSFSLTRTDWQILNTLSEQGSIHQNELTVLMKPFLSLTSVEDALSQLKNKQLIIEEDQNLKLTDKGKEHHTACLERQKKFRQDTMAGISEENYQTTIATLQKIVANINHSPA